MFSIRIQLLIPIIITHMLQIYRYFYPVGPVPLIIDPENWKVCIFLLYIIPEAEDVVAVDYNIDTKYKWQQKLERFQPTASFLDE